MKLFSSFVWFSLLACLTQTAYGERWYDVEVIVFAHDHGNGVQEEVWPEKPGQPDIENAVSLVKPDNSERLPGQIIEFEALSLRMLSGTLQRLNRSGRYRVISAKAWRLPGLPKRLAPPVRIRAGAQYTDNGNLAVPNDLMDSGNTPVNNALYEIDGRIRISLSKYLDVDTDLLYRTHVTLPDQNNIPGREFRAFRLKEFRRMKSKTIHYLDHPMFGVLIGIYPYQPAAITTTDLSSTDQ